MKINVFLIIKLEPLKYSTHKRIFKKIKTFFTDRFIAGYNNVFFPREKKIRETLIKFMKRFSKKNLLFTRKIKSSH